MGIRVRRRGRFLVNQPRTGPVDLSVFDIQGRLVATPFRGNVEAGEHAVTWNGENRRGQPVPSGAYFVRLVTRGKTVRLKIVKLR